MKSILLSILSFSILSANLFAENAPTPKPSAAAEKSEKTLSFESVLIDFAEATKEGVKKVSSVADKAVDFAEKEIPSVIKEYLYWHWFESFLYFCIGISLIIVGIVGVKKFAIDTRNEEWLNRHGCTDVGFLAVTSLIIGIIFSVVGPITALSNTKWIKISIAPRVFLLEEGAKLIKK